MSSRHDGGNYNKHGFYDRIRRDEHFETEVRVGRGEMSPALINIMPLEVVQRQLDVHKKKVNQKVWMGDVQS